MTLALSLGLFTVCVIFTLSLNLPMSLAMTAGMIIFFCAGLHKGFKFYDLLRMSVEGAKESLIVVKVLLIIGVMTGLWRSAGTFAVLTAWGLRVITPSMFIFAAFGLSCILSYALGTSSGAAGTLGIALMTLARSGGVNPTITAGAVMSGIYFGDRGSPVSSCVHLVTSLTGTDLYGNVREFMRTTIMPLVLSGIFYFVLSVMNPLNCVSSGTLDELSLAFILEPVVSLPAVIMLILPLLKVNIFFAFLASITAAGLCSVYVQGLSVIEALRAAVLGYHSAEGIGVLFNGGGLVSMVQTCIVLIISGTFSGIFGGTGMLEVLQDRILGLIERWGVYRVMLVIGTMCNGVFCNQTVGIMMTAQLLKHSYGSDEVSRREFARDIADTTAITAPLITWCIACSLPLGMMGAENGSLIYACYLYLIPLCRLLSDKSRKILR